MSWTTPSERFLFWMPRIKEIVMKKDGNDSPQGVASVWPGSEHVILMDYVANVHQ